MDQKIVLITKSACLILHVAISLKSFGILYLWDTLFNIQSFAKQQF